MVKRIGTRIVHLESSIVLLSESEGLHDEVPINVKLELFDRSLNAQKLAIANTKPESDVILAAVSQYGYAEPKMLSERVQDYEQKEKIKAAISKLAEYNVLRYSKRGLLTWHGQVEKEEFETVSE